jgi:heme exporter protein CcmD
MPNFELGKYAVYILPAYAFTAVVIAALVADTLLRTRRWKAEAARLEALKNKKS